MNRINDGIIERRMRSGWTTWERGDWVAQVVKQSDGTWAALAGDGKKHMDLGRFKRKKDGTDAALATFDSDGTAGAAHNAAWPEEK